MSSWSNEYVIALRARIEKLECALAEANYQVGVARGDLAYTEKLLARERQGKDDAESAVREMLADIRRYEMGAQS